MIANDNESYAINGYLHANSRVRWFNFGGKIGGDKGRTRQDKVKKLGI